METRSLRARGRLGWIDIAPWVLIALLAHVALWLAVYVWSPRVGPIDERVTAVSIVVGPNPFDPPAVVAAPARTEVRDSLDNTSSTPDTTVDPPLTVELELLDLLTPPAPSSEAFPTVVEPGISTTADTLDAPGPSPKEGAGGAYTNRVGSGKAQALAAYGGDSESESSVHAGLSWLTAHQREDGAWDRRHFDDRCPQLDVCRETAVSWPGTDATPAITGLAVLALLGAGNSHESGEFQKEVASALHYLVSRQRANGCFGPRDRMELYNDAIATFALAEAYALTRDAAFARAVRSGVAHLLDSQQSCGGWDYTSDVTTQRCDLSITGWAVMALKAASGAGVAIPDSAVIGIVTMVSDHTGADGLSFYANKGTGTVTDRAAGTLTRRYGPAMTAVGALVRQLLGWRRDSAILELQASWMLAELPDVARLRGGDKTGLHSEYYWYYATLAMFNQGEPGWSRWNVAMRDALLQTQDRAISPTGARRHSYGSWPAFGRGWGKWGRGGGRIYSTALAVLSLEVYYRYQASFLATSGLIRPSTLRAGLANRQGTDRDVWVEVIRQQPVRVAEPVLLDLLKDGSARVRLRAAVGLAQLGSPAGESVLSVMRPAALASERQAIDNALEYIAGLTFPPKYGQVVRMNKDGTTVVFDTGGTAVYLGQLLHIKRDEQRVASLRVTHRRPQQQIAAGKIIETFPDNRKPSVGDVVYP